jgi:hypothetical protein
MRSESRAPTPTASLDRLVMPSLVKMWLRWVVTPVLPMSKDAGGLAVGAAGHHMFDELQLRWGEGCATPSTDAYVCPERARRR